MIKPVFTGRIKDGVLTIDRRFTFNRYLKTIEDEKVLITIEPLKGKRTLAQNRYYWTYLTLVADETGNSVDDLHEWAKRKFLTPKFITVKGETMKIARSTTELSKDEWSPYLIHISQAMDVPLMDTTEFDQAPLK